MFADPLAMDVLKNFVELPMELVSVKATSHRKDVASFDSSISSNLLLYYSIAQSL